MSKKPKNIDPIRNKKMLTFGELMDNVKYYKEYSKEYVSEEISTRDALLIVLIQELNDLTRLILEINKK
nr:hypothetical protein [Candidatus Sigynarchaeota archaeon]